MKLLPCRSRALCRWEDSFSRCWRDSSCCRLTPHRCPPSPPHPLAPDLLFPSETWQTLVCVPPRGMELTTEHPKDCLYAQVRCGSYREWRIMGTEVVPAFVLQLLHHLVHGALQPRFNSDACLSQQVQTGLCFHFDRLSKTWKHSYWQMQTRSYNWTRVSNIRINNRYSVYYQARQETSKKSYLTVLCICLKLSQTIFCLLDI